MRTVRKAMLLRLHFGEADQHQVKPLYEAIVDRARALGSRARPCSGVWKATVRAPRFTAITSSGRISRSW